VHVSSLVFFLTLLPLFIGGTYGFARVTVGPFIGFLVGCFEVFSNLVSTAGGAIPIAVKITYITGWSQSYEPLYLLALYLFMIGWELIGRKYYFSFLKCLAIVILSLVIIFLVTSAQYVDTEQYLPTSEVSSTYAKGGIIDLLSIMPYTGFYYFGLDIIPLVCDEVKNVRDHIFWLGIHFSYGSFSFSLFLFLSAGEDCCPESDCFRCYRYDNSFFLCCHLYFWFITWLSG
jgi:ethanolamine permease